MALLVGCTVLAGGEGKKMAAPHHVTEHELIWSKILSSWTCVLEMLQKVTAEVSFSK